MKNKLIGWVSLSSIFLLSACSSTETQSSSSSESKNIIRTTEQTSYISSDLATNVKTSQSSQKTNFPYAVNIADFTQTVQVNGEEKTIYHKNFTTTQANQPQGIVVNMKDLNNYGKAIYITFADGKEETYPITVTTVPEKVIQISGIDGTKRSVTVNTELVVADSTTDSTAPTISGDSYYLFYNKQKTLSLAVRDFDHNEMGTSLEDAAMIEYIETE